MGCDKDYPVTLQLKYRDERTKFVEITPIKTFVFDVPFARRRWQPIRPMLQRWLRKVLGGQFSDSG